MALYVDPADAGPADLPTEEFSWSLNGRIRAVDNGATLVCQEQFLEYMDMNAFTVIAFDPASRLQDQTHLQDIDHLQIVPHALLGDGQMTTLHACIDPDMSGTLEPLDEDELQEAQREGARVLAQLPITTLPLDSIDDVTSVDWLLLDAVNDNIAVLDNSVETLREALLIHAYIPLMPTHRNQTGLGDMCQWMSSHGFECYQFNRMGHFSHLPDNQELERTQATRVSALEAIFTPSESRLATYDADRLTKLAFLLDAVYNINDYSYALLHRADPTEATRYLVSRGYISGYDAEPDTFTLTAQYSPIPCQAAEPVTSEEIQVPTADEIETNDADELFASGTTAQNSGQLPDAVAYYRAALSARLDDPLASSESKPQRVVFNRAAANSLMSNTLNRLAKAGVHAFTTSMTLLGLTRDNGLPPGEDLYFGLPFCEQDRAKRCLEYYGWVAQTSEHITNPMTYVYPELQITLNLAGFVADEDTGTTYSGIWMDNIPWAWASLREWPVITVEKDVTPEFQPIWTIGDSAAHLEVCFGDWRTPEPHFDPVIADKNLCSFSLLTQCHAFAGLYECWEKGQPNKALARVGHIRKHLPHDDLVQRLDTHLQARSESGATHSQNRRSATALEASQEATQ